MPAPAWLGVLKAVQRGFIAAIWCVGVVVVVEIARGGQGLGGDDAAVLTVAVSTGIATAVLGVIGMWWQRRRVMRHRARMRSWADARGWAYRPRSTVLSSRWSERGVPGSTHTTDVLRRTGPRGEVVSLTLGPGWGLGRPSRHAVMVVGPRRFPALSVTPMTARGRAARAVGGQDLTVESYEVNERWRIRCADARFAHDVLNPRLLERLSRADLPGLSFLVEERDVVVHTPGRTDLARVELMADLVLDLAALLPTYLPDDYPPFGPEVPRRDRRKVPRRDRGQTSRRLR